MHHWFFLIFQGSSQPITGKFGKIVKLKSVSMKRDKIKSIFKFPPEYSEINYIYSKWDSRKLLKQCNGPINMVSVKWNVLMLKSEGQWCVVCLLNCCKWVVSMAIHPFLQRPSKKMDELPWTAISLLGWFSFTNSLQLKNWRCRWHIVRQKISIDRSCSWHFCYYI